MAGVFTERVEISVMPRALIVADDLTGATDTAHAFAKRGYETRVQVDPENDSLDSTVLAVNTDSRYVNPETATGRVRRAIEATDASVVYKKVDSTLRGNVLAEIRAAMGCGFDFGLFVPVSPPIGRVTASGYHLVDGCLVTDTEYADDPNGPSSAHLPTLVEEIDTTHLGIEIVAAGSEAIQAALADAPPSMLFTCDATHDRHLDALARASEHIDGRPLYIGSAGLAEHVKIPGESDHEPHRPTAEGAALGIVGSVSETTLTQLAALPPEWVIALDPAGSLDDPESTGTTAGRRAATRLAVGEHAVITAAPDRTTVERTIRIGHNAGLSDEGIRERVGRALASAASEAFEGDPVGLFVTGGDVAMAVFSALDVSSIALSGEEVEAGIPLSYLDGGVADDTPVITKAGGFGREETVINCLDALGGDNE